MGRIAKWFIMLSKRLYKKPSFLALLLLIPACVGIFTVSAQQDSGFVHIVLAQERAGDTLSTEIICDLLEEDSMVHFSLAESPDKAVEAVGTGLADEAWIFPADTEASIRDFVTGKQAYVVQSVIREETTLLQLAREKLPSAMFEYCAKAHYIDYVRKHFAELDGVTDGELATYFEQVKVSEDMFLYGDPTNVNNEADGINYLTSPIRGLLSVVMLLCCIAATLFYMQDDEVGTFCWVNQRCKGLTAFGCVTIAGVNVSVVVLLALLVSGLVANVFVELAALFLYCLCSAGFCLLLKAVFPTISSYSAIIPLLTVLVTGICPVFIDFRKWEILQLVFPPTYYINGLYDGRYFLYGIIYIPVCLALAWLISHLQKTFRK